jgi:hypothetical protein
MKSIFVSRKEKKKGTSMTEALYVCPACNKEIIIESSEPGPSCCRVKMKARPLPFCRTAPNPEMARSDREDTPCDDGTGPKRS